MCLTPGPLFSLFSPHPPATPTTRPPVVGAPPDRVNFMKNEKQYDGKTSDVLRMVQEMDKNPAPETEGEVANLASPDKNVVQGYSFKLLQQSLQGDPELGRSARTRKSLFDH